MGRGTTSVLIVFFRKWYYRIYESIRLRYERYRNRNDYDFYPLISIITPTYNRGELLKERTIKSVLAQTYKNFEFIIVSDGSTDNTKEMVESIKDDRIRFFEIKRKRPHHNYNEVKNWFIGGTYPANFALSKVRGRWIARIDDDDIWTKDHLKKLLDFAEFYSFEFVSATYDIMKNGVRTKFSPVYFKSPYFYPKRKGIDLESPQIGGHSCWLYRSYLKFMKYNPQAWRKSWNKVEDTDLSLRMYEAGVRIGYIDDVLAHLIPRPGELSVGLEAVKEKIKNVE